jgi:CYTH domain-containing protein
MKYAHVERERRYLFLGVVIGISPIRNLLINDRYINGSNLRLRRIEEDSQPTVFKLGQKIRIGGEHPLKIAHTTMYISENEFDSLLGLPAKVLVKKRSVFPHGDYHFSVDVFEGELTGLSLVEVDLGEEGTSYEMLPLEKTIEVTSDERFTGGKLADTSSEDLLCMLKEYGAK